MAPRRDPTYRDLSQPMETAMTTFPGDPEVTISPAATVEEDGVSVHELRCGTHSGTHIDASSHTEPGGADVDDRPIGEYAFGARLIDVTPCEPREPIGVDRLPNDPGEDVDLVVVRTGWDAHWNATSYLDHPHVTPAAARRLRDAGCGLAVDALNPDPTPSATGSTAAESTVTDPTAADEPEGFPVHRALLGANLPILENLTGLDRVPERFRLYAFPLSIPGVDGSPVRAVAEIEGTSDGADFR